VITYNGINLASAPQESLSVSSVPFIGTIDGSSVTLTTSGLLAGATIRPAHFGSGLSAGTLSDCIVNTKTAPALRRARASARRRIADLVRATASTGWPYPSEQIDRLWPFMVQSGDLPHLVPARRLLL
jgi:hypothetical protein